MLKDYYQFINEVKKEKLNFFRNNEISNLFYCSIEIEIETEDDFESDEDYSVEFVSEIIKRIKNSVIKELLRIDDFILSNDIEEFIDNILDEISHEYEDYEIFDNLIDEDKYTELNYKKLIISLIKPQVITYFFKDNYHFLEERFKENLPNFYEKYSEVIKFELDNTLNKGIEISNIKYFNNINDLIEMIEIFYKDFSSQNYWIFNENTGIHINIGPKNTSHFNYIKGLLFLNDNGAEPFVFKNMEWRKKSEFCKSLLEELSKNKEIINIAQSRVKNNKISLAENLMNTELLLILRNIGYKKFGVNLTPVKRFNYVEFRYPGGEISKDTLIDKVLYFTYILYLMVNNDFDKKEYQKKLFKYTNKKTPD